MHWESSQNAAWKPQDQSQESPSLSETSGDRTSLSLFLLTFWSPHSHQNGLFSFAYGIPGSWPTTLNIYALVKKFQGLENHVAKFITGSNKNIAAGFCVSNFLHCYYGILDKKQYRERGIYFGSLLQWYGVRLHP